MEQDDARHGAKMASSATSTGSGGAGTMTDTDVDMEEADMTQWTEAEFEEKCTYIVKDTACEVGPDGDAMMMSTTRAEASLPRNLAFKHLAGSKEVRLSLTLKHSHIGTCWQTDKLSLQPEYFIHIEAEKGICTNTQM